MVIQKALYGTLALTVMLAFSPLPSAQAASLIGPGTKVEADTNIDLVAKKGGKKKKVKKKAKAKAKADNGDGEAGDCGVYFYLEEKTGKCTDARITPPDLAN
ncbi:MAG: hypothetical protein ACREC6_04255 [Hyphomicrobiaceae bacterium]